MPIRILVNGAGGRMGQEAVAAISADPELDLVGEAHRHDDLSQKIKTSDAEVVVDLTVADVAFQNASTIIAAGVHPVIGTSGFNLEQVTELQQRCNQQQLGGIIAPNFSIGAVLMMKFAKEAARYFPDAEIIEMHHNQKQDAPSGTAIKTAFMIAEGREQSPQQLQGKELLPGARGATSEEVPIHSIRLSGLVAHQQVMFGGRSETLTLRHDSIHRDSFMPGVCLSCKAVMELKQLVYGLEHIL